MAKHGVQLYSAWFCPFAQRSWIALNEKGVDFELVEVDPYNKTPQFLAINPRGLVPTLVHDGRSVYESLILNEYIEETWPQEPRLMPADPFPRAQGRIWIDFISKKIVPPFYQYLMRQEKSEQELAKESFVDGLKEFTAAMDPEGPFFFGKGLSLVDIALIPFGLRLEVLQHYRGFSLPEDGSLDRFKLWADACKSRPTVSSTMAPKDDMLAIYRRYAENTAQSEMAVAINKGTPLP